MWPLVLRDQIAQVAYYSGTRLPVASHWYLAPVPRILPPRTSHLALYPRPRDHYCGSNKLILQYYVGICWLTATFGGVVVTFSSVSWRSHAHRQAAAQLRPRIAPVMSLPIRIVRRLLRWRHFRINDRVGTSTTSGRKQWSFRRSGGTQTIPLHRRRRRGLGFIHCCRACTNI